jgi:hypothetical protein
MKKLVNYCGLILTYTKNYVCFYIHIKLIVQLYLIINTTQTQNYFKTTIKDIPLLLMQRGKHNLMSIVLWNSMNNILITNIL